MAKNKAMGDNPLFVKHETTEDAQTIFNANEITQIKEAEAAANTVYQTMSFKIREDQLKLLRDYAYTERIQVKDALEAALTDFFNKHTDLLEAPEKPKQIRRRK